VQKDPSISAKILSVANSSFFGFKIPTSTVSNAIIRIGFNNVKNIAIGISMMTVLDNGEIANRAFYNRVFEHSAAVGIISRFISENIKLDISEEILFSGLLHDLGFLVLCRYFNDSCEQVLNVFESEESLLSAEQAVLGFGHVDIGAWLAKEWFLPECVLDAVYYHHDPSSAKNNLKHVAIVHLADYITARNFKGVTKKDPAYPFCESCLDMLGITKSDMKHIEGKISSELSNAADIFS
jgi:HD-like signal output (HDOD) protein